MDLDFFGKKNPSKKKVKTAMGFRGVTKVDADSTDDMKKAIASTIGGDVKAEDIIFTKIHFPVKAKLKLSTSMVRSSTCHSFIQFAGPNCGMHVLCTVRHWR